MENELMIKRVEALADLVLVMMREAVALEIVDRDAAMAVLTTALMEFVADVPSREGRSELIARLTTALAERSEVRCRERRMQ